MRRRAIASPLHPEMDRLTGELTQGSPDASADARIDTQNDSAAFEARTKVRVSISSER